MAIRVQREDFDPGREIEALTAGKRCPPLDLHKIQCVVLVPQQRDDRTLRIHSLYLR